MPLSLSEILSTNTFWVLWSASAEDHRRQGARSPAKKCRDQGHTASDLWPLGFPPSPAGNSAAEVSFEEPAGADLQTRGRPGTEVGGGCLGGNRR